MAFGDRVRAAATTMSTISGMRFYYDGQFEGRRTHLPMQLGVDAAEPVDDRMRAFYRRLLTIIDQETFHNGEWRILDIAPAGDDTHEQIAAWRILVRVLQARYGIPNERVYAHNWIDYKDARYCEGCDLATLARSTAFSAKP